MSARWKPRVSRATNYWGLGVTVYTGEDEVHFWSSMVTAVHRTVEVQLGRTCLVWSWEVRS